MGNVSNGFDPGAVGGGVREADVALQWAMALRWVGITKFGVNPSDIVLTRDDSSDVTPVGGRDDLAFRNKCTHLLSLHCNSAGPLASGTETLYSQDKGQGKSMAFAGIVQKCALKAMRSKDRGLKSENTTRHGNLAVFGLADKMSACLLEIGFISNSGDRAKMLDRDVRVAFAEAFWTAMGFRKVL